MGAMRSWRAKRFTLRADATIGQSVGPISSQMGSERAPCSIHTGHQLQPLRRTRGTYMASYFKRGMTRPRQRAIISTYGSTARKVQDVSSHNHASCG